MSRPNPLSAGEMPTTDLPADDEGKLVLVDDEAFVKAFAEAGRRRGKKLVCARCFDPAQALKALVLLLDAEKAMIDECAGSVGLCSDCYRALTECMFHNSVLRAAKPN